MESVTLNLSALLDKIPQPYLLVFGVLGLFFVLKKVINFLHLLFSLFVLPGKNLREYGDEDSWVMITGASDGLGKEYATQLARNGWNLVLVSRTESKLQALASELEQKYDGVKTKILAIDFAKNDDGDYARLKALADGLDIGILINNVGMSHSMPVPFVLTPKEEMADIITINCIATLKVTQIIAPRMVQRKRGLILTMGSFGGLFPTPLLATYSGSKAFLQQWSTALGGELQGTGVDVELCLAHLVTTAMSKIRKTSLVIPNPKTFVKSALGKVGRRGPSNIAFTNTPYWRHAIMQWIIDSTAGVGSPYVVKRNRMLHESIRNRGLRKIARQAKKV